MRGMRREVRVIKMAGVSKTQTSKTQTSKRKRKDELRDLNSLRSRAKAVFVFVTRLCFLGLRFRGLRFRGLRFRELENADLENADLANKDLENTDVSQTQKQPLLASVMNLSPLVCLFFFFSRAAFSRSAFSRHPWHSGCCILCNISNNNRNKDQIQNSVKSIGIKWEWD